MKFVTVLKSGGDFDQEYVNRIYNSIDFEWLKQFDIEFVCLSDMDGVPNKIPLLNQHVTDPAWKGWWSKMEMFRPDIFDDDLFYMDLDTIIMKRNTMEDVLLKFRNVSLPVMLDDFYYPEKLASGMLFIPNHVKRNIWNNWNKNASMYMQKFHGDQDYLEQFLLFNQYAYTTFNNLISDFACSYKAHIQRKVPEGINPLKVNPYNSIVTCFHGKPRPRDVNWRLEEEKFI